MAARGIQLSKCNHEHEQEHDPVALLCAVIGAPSVLLSSGCVFSRSPEVLQRGHAVGRVALAQTLKRLPHHRALATFPARARARNSQESRVKSQGGEGACACCCTAGQYSGETRAHTRTELR